MITLNNNIFNYDQGVFINLMYHLSTYFQTALIIRLIVALYVKKGKLEKFNNNLHYFLF